MPINKVQFKERSARRAIRAARKEGLVVGSLEVEPDGTIRVLAAPPGTKSQDSELDKWLGEHPDAGQTQGHQ